MPVRIFAFGGLNGGPWGAAWIAPEADQAVLLGPGGKSGAVSLQMEGEASDRWRVASGATELTLEGLGEPAWSDGSDQAAGFDQLCQVSGVLAGVAGRQEVRCLGWRSARPHPLGPGRLESLRQVAGWFDPDDGFALLALRREGGQGQDQDQISAALFSPTGARPVADPRLSTTYTGSDEPTRASVELWVETEGDPETQYPRRAIGEATAAAAQSRAGELWLEARPFRWYGGGREGAGVYLIGRAA